MNGKEYLGQYRKKIRTESILKSLIFAAAIAFIGSFITSFAIWFTEFSGWWISIIVFVALLAAVTPIVYFLKYRPTVKEVAKRLDMLGLEERVLTMTELEGDDSIMAVHQRISAMDALGSVSNKMLKFAVSGISIAALAVSCVFGVGMTTVEALSKQGRAPTGSMVVTRPDPEVFYILRYEIVCLDTNGNPVKDAFGCEIDGEAEQIVLAGTDASPVLAYVEDEGGEDWVWVFYGWFDELDYSKEPLSTDPYREDLSVDLTDGIYVIEDGETIITHYAVFMQVIVDGEPQEGDGEGEGEEGDAPSDAPQEGNEGEGQPGEPGEDGSGDGAGGGEHDPGNQIIDGDTFYGEKFDEYYQLWQEYLASGVELPDYLKKFVEEYYANIKN